MRLRVVGYQVQVRLRTLLPCFHKAHIENLALMVVGMVFAQSFSLPAVLAGFKTKRVNERVNGKRVKSRVS